MKTVGSIEGLGLILEALVEMYRGDLATAELLARDLQQVTRSRTDVVSNLMATHAAEAIAATAQRRSQLGVLQEFADIISAPGADSADRLAELEKRLADVFPESLT